MPKRYNFCRQKIAKFFVKQEKTGLEGRFLLIGEREEKTF